MMDHPLLAIYIGISKRELLVKCVGLMATLIHHFS